MDNKIKNYNVIDPNTRILILFLQAAVAVMKYSQRFFQVRGLSANQFLVLQILSMNKGTMSHKEISRWTQTKANNTTTMIDRMIKGGLVRREIDAHDKRYVWVIITPKGIKTLIKSQPVARELVKKIMASLAEPEKMEDNLRILRDRCAK